MNQNFVMGVLIERHDTVIDSSTGEVLESRLITQALRYKANRPYIKIYIDDALEDLIKLNKGEFALLHYCFRLANFNNEFSLLKVDKEIIAKELDVTLGTINNGITILVKTGLIVRRAMGAYKLNPHYFSKGKDKPVVH